MIESSPVKDALTGTIYWKNADGFLHREDGPSIIWKNGDYMWYYLEKAHCAIGPAMKIGNTVLWYYHGVYFNYQEEWFEALTLEEKRRAIWSLNG